MNTEENNLLAETVLDSLENYKLLELVLDNLGVGVIVVNSDGEIIIVNKTAEFISGYHRSEIKGQLVEILVPEEAKPMHPEHRSSYREEPLTRPMGKDLNLELVKKGGSRTPVVISLGSFMTPKGVYTTATIQRK